MRLQVLDETVRFTCGTCTLCCEQPWRTLIEPDRAAALDTHDWSRYPGLAGKTFYRKPAGGKDELYELAKGEGDRCLFLDTDGLCIVHKELGPEAKPHMCQQFPYLSARTWTDDRVSCNYGCPSVQNLCGTRLEEQKEDIASLVPVTARPANPDGPVPLDGGCNLTQAEGDALFERLTALFVPGRADDLWSRFAEAVSLLAAVKAHHETDGADDLIDRLRSGDPLPDTPDLPEIHAFASPSDAPTAVRFLFAITLYPDTLPADAGTGLRLIRRLAQVPKLMNLAKLSGGFASRVLGRNVSIADVLRHDVEPALDEATTALLARYYRSRLWQRLPAGTRMTVIEGVHQHIRDFGAILFYARAEALRTGHTQLTEKLVRDALTRVEFHLANQARVWEQSKGWFRSHVRGLLQDPILALGTLRLMALRPAPQPVAAPHAE